MPLIETKGAASAQGFGGAGAGASGPVTYIEEVFSTWLYTGNGSTQTITNGIDLSTKGGLVWTKRRSGAVANSHLLIDTARGPNNGLATDQNVAQTTGWYPTYFTGFTSTGYGVSGAAGENNATSSNYVSWTFREQPKFFDIVTYTGNGANRTISHNLGSVPGCIIVKRTDAAADWQIYHRSLANTQYLVLNDTAAAATGTTRWNSTTPTSTVFSLGTDTTVNASGGTYVAYLFAHNAGGFGLTGSDNVISCGSFTTDSGGIVPEVNLGYEPQWVMVKRTDSTGPWFLLDTMRGYALTNTKYLYANDSIAEASWSTPYLGYPTATGFKGDVNSGIANGTFIYIAIRRGPMKVPTSGTSVYANFYSNYSAGAILTSNFPVDLSIWKGNTVWDWSWDDRLRGTSTAVDTGKASLASNSAAAENNGWAYLGAAKFDNNTGVSVSYKADSSRSNQASYALLRRAPSFFDEVCYTGTGSAMSNTHNLGVTPELMIVKDRSGFRNWFVWTTGFGVTDYLELNNTSAKGTGANIWNSTAPTSTTFSVNGVTAAYPNNFVAYLFATCAGVSKVGTYTGTGALQTVNCGFTGGARFVLIKRTDSTGDWYVYDSARGISSGSDPYLFLNSTAAEVTGTNYVDTTSVGFQVTAAAPAGLNANGGTYIFLAIA